MPRMCLNALPLGTTLNISLMQLQTNVTESIFLQTQAD